LHKSMKMEKSLVSLAKKESAQQIHENVNDPKMFSHEHAKLVFKHDSHNPPGEWEKLKLLHPTHVVIQSDPAGDIGYIICHENDVQKWMDRLKEHQIEIDHIEYRNEVYEHPETLEKSGRCWAGYRPVPGKKPYSPGSCAPIGKK